MSLARPVIADLERANSTADAQEDPTAPPPRIDPKREAEARRLLSRKGETVAVVTRKQGAVLGEVIAPLDRDGDVIIQPFGARPIAITFADVTGAATVDANHNDLVRRVSRSQRERFGAGHG